MNIKYLDIKNKISKYKNDLRIKKKPFIRNFNIKFLFRKKLHFIHIGKTAGSSIRNSLIHFNNSQKKYHFNIYGHSFKLYHLAKKEKYFLTIRNPVNRFVSGFLSQQNRVKFEIENKITEEEKYIKGFKEREAFKNFSDANHLAESLFSDDLAIKTKAGSAMKNTKHLNDPYADYFSKEDLIERKPLFVLELEKLDSDFSEFCKKFKLEVIALPKEKKLTHKGDYSNNKELSEGAILNLKKWYKDDFDLYYFILENKKNWNIRK